MADPVDDAGLQSAVETNNGNGEIAVEKPDLLPGGFHRFRPVYDADDDFQNVETNTARPPTDAVLTIRVIKSFAYRTMKPLVLRHVDLTSTTVDELLTMCSNEVKTNPTFKAFRSFADKLDTFKIYTKAHGSKTTNLIINLDKPEWILHDKSQRLIDLALENESELSLFNQGDYNAFIANPETKW